MNEKEKDDSKLVCEMCGKDFSCGANQGKCWCFEVVLDQNELENLRKKFKNCLCADCLKSNSEILLAE